MDCQEPVENTCRICLEEDVDVDWNDYLEEFMTYKDCYYKYTQLECFDGDNLYLSKMLCRNCSNTLKNINTFISKAVATHHLLQERLAMKFTKGGNDSDIKTSFERVLISETDRKPDIENVPMYGDKREDCLEKNDDCSLTEDAVTSKNQSRTKRKRKLIKIRNKQENNETSSNELQTDKTMSQNSNHIENITKYEDKRKDCLEDACSLAEDAATSKNQTRTKRKRKLKKIGNQQENNETSSNELQNDKPISKKNNHCSKPWQIPTCCSICPKVLHSKYQAIEHEKTHLKNRVRNETCKECGMQFYSKDALNGHMQTHIKGREKTKKCEFCEKAFYFTGALNVHRRIHLGQMTKCTLCQKEFYRQIDLNRHLISHSVTRIGDELKTRVKYFVCCAMCGENVRSVNYKSHAAKHMNEPLAKCAICNKEFFSRESCISHLKAVHKKGTGERSKFAISYNTSRYSNLFLEQSVGKLFLKQE